MPKKKNLYWTEEVDYGMRLYQQSTNQIEKNKIYNKYLNKPFRTLAEIVIRKWNFQYLPDNFYDTKNEIVSFMLSKINNYDVGKGKSYSYFTIVCKNRLIYLNNRNYEKIKTRSTTPLDSLTEMEIITHNVVKKNFTSGSHTSNDDVLVDVLDNFASFLKRNEHNLLKGKYKKMIPTLRELFEDRARTLHFNKLKIMEFFRTRTGLTQREIIYGIKTIKELYKSIHSQTIEKGEIDKTWEKLVTI